MSFCWQPCMNKYLSHLNTLNIICSSSTPSCINYWLPSFQRWKAFKSWIRDQGQHITYICRNNELNLVIKCFTPQPYLVHLFRLHPNRFLLVLSPPSPNISTTSWLTTRTSLTHPFSSVSLSLITFPPVLFATLIRGRVCKWANPTRICNCHYDDFHRRLGLQGSCRCPSISSRR